MPTPERVDLGKTSPDAKSALSALDRVVRDLAEGAGIEEGLLDLVRLRASQINGCEFCLGLHTAEALEHGERDDRLEKLASWRDSTAFTAREKAALRLTEAITLVADGRVSDADYITCSAELSSDELASIAWASITINAYNRLAIASRYQLPRNQV